MEKLCIFCQHFTWTKVSIWGMGSEYTGPMMEGGWAECAKKQFKNLEAPDDEADFRRVILMGEKCEFFESAVPARNSTSSNPTCAARRRRKTAPEPCE